MTMRRSILWWAVLAIGCGKHDGGDDGASTSGGTDSFTSGHSHSGSDPSAVSLTFTNTSDPTEDPSGDPDTDPSADPTTDPSTDPTTEGSADSSSGGSESSGPADGSSGGSESSSDSGNPSGMCCEAQDGAGCGDDTIEACVCARDSACCDVAWDEFCTVQVVLLGCDECPGIGGDGDCCAAHDNPGCDDDMVEACVCAQDFVCCTEAWDDVCADEAAGCGASC